MQKPTNLELELITGAAGTGKTTLLKKRMEGYAEKGRRYAALMATTGIAAINLSGASGDTVVTVNSALKFFDTASLKDNFAAGRLHRILKEISRGYRKIAIDECSMMDKEQLDILVSALKEVNELQEVFNRGGLGLILSGDFAQLSPVKAEFCFNATCWKEFQITKLTKIFRQSDPEFLEMLNAARRGDGEKTAELAYAIQDIKFLDIIDSHFEGTTIVAVNKQVDRMNEVRLQELIGQGKRLFEFPTFRWGRQYKEWTGIPDIIQVCESAYVMILANDSPNFTYANGSCGHVVDADIDAGRVYVKLQGRGEDENELEVKVRKVTRKYLEKNVPEGYQPVEKWLSRSEWEKDNREKGIESFGNDEVMYKSYLMQLTQASKDRNGNCKPYFDFLEEKWVTGEVTYTPIRLAYATTVYKSQGLSLDKVQIDYSHEFFGSPSMSYVALSRCRTPNGLTIVGNKKLIEQRTNISSEILDWL